jgi:hypothetical protein
MAVTPPPFRDSVTDGKVNSNVWMQWFKELYKLSSIDVVNKADKVVGAVNGNFASLTATGNLGDSGHKDADYADAVHVHEAAGSGGQLDHGLAITAASLLDDDHTGYLKEKANGGLAAEVPTHTHADAANAGTVAHSALTGLTSPADDHTQYQLESLLPTVAIVILSTTTGIDAKVVATTNLYTVPAGKTCVVCSTIVRVTAANNITVVPTLGVGIAAGEDDILSSAATTGLNTLGEMWRADVEGVAVTGAAGEIIKLGIDVGATATTMTIAVDLTGYLV